MSRTFHIDYTELALPMLPEIVFSPVGGGEAMIYVEEKFGICNTWAELVGSTWVVKETADRDLVGSICGKLEKMPTPAIMASLMS